MRRMEFQWEALGVGLGGGRGGGGAGEGEGGHECCGPVIELFYWIGRRR